MKPKTKVKQVSLSSAKKKAWVNFSIYIRTRDCLETTGCANWGLCVTCGKRLHFKLLQAGHFIAGRNNAVLFEEKGVHAQCYVCNINLKGNTLIYRRKVIEKYGEGIDEEMEKSSKVLVKYTVQDYIDIADKYKAKTKELLAL